MNVHKNARSCPASRELLYKRVSEQGWSVRAASEAAGMSDRRGREWIGRAVREEPLTDRSSRPHGGRATPATTRDQIIALRRERRTIRQIALVAGVSSSTVARICRGAGLNRLRNLDPPPPPVRYERDDPGELLHIDIKRLGRFDRVGHRITRQRSFGSKKQGFERRYVVRTPIGTHRACHDRQRLRLRVTRLAERCKSLGVRHKRIRPYTPRTNGKAERFIQTLLREWAYRFAYDSSAERKRWLIPYTPFYNYHRAHSALAYNQPISRLGRNNVLTNNS